MRTLLLLGGAAVLLAGCRTTRTPEPPPPAPMLVASSHYVGTVWTGPLPESEQLPDLSARGPWTVRAEVAYAAHAPAGGRSLSGLTQQIFGERGASPLRVRSRLAAGVACYGPDLAVVLPAPAESRTELVWPGTTQRTRTVWNPVDPTPAQAPWQVCDLHVSRRFDDPDRAELALTLTGKVALGNGEEADEREHLILDAGVLAVGEPLLFFLPAPREEAPDGGLLARVLVTPDTAALTADELDQARARALAGLEEAGQEARARARKLASGEGFRFESRRALDFLGRPGAQRSALIFLSGATEARITQELGLDGGPDVLAAFLQGLRERVEAGEARDASAQELGWFLEHATLEWLALRADDSDRPLEPELQALLLRTTGEVGRYPDLLGELLEECTSVASLQERLLQENTIFLEDSKPASRVRAFDWLDARRAAPAGYDPLADRDARRDALDAALEEAQAAAAPTEEPR